MSLSDHLWTLAGLIFLLAVVLVGMPLVVATFVYIALFIHQHYGFAAFVSTMIEHEKFKLVFWGAFGIACLGAVVSCFDRQGHN